MTRLFRALRRARDRWRFYRGWKRYQRRRNRHLITGFRPGSFKVKA